MPLTQVLLLLLLLPLLYFYSLEPLSCHAPLLYGDVASDVFTNHSAAADDRRCYLPRGRLHCCNNSFVCSKRIRKHYITLHYITQLHYCYYYFSSLNCFLDLFICSLCCLLIWVDHYSTFLRSHLSYLLCCCEYMNKFNWFNSWNADPTFAVPPSV